MKTNKPVLAAAHAVKNNKEVREIIQRLKQIRRENKSDFKVLRNSVCLREANTAGMTDWLVDRMLRATSTR